MRILVTRNLPGPALDRLRAEHTVTVWPGPLPPPRAELVAQAAASDALLTLLSDTVDADLFACSDLRAVSNYAVGFENIDTAAATIRGIPVGHTPGVLTEATAQLTLTLILNLLRRVSEADNAVHRGRWRSWDPAGYLGSALSETTVGLIGYGRIGQAVATMAASLGMRVLVANQRGGGTALEDVLAQSDLISLHARLTPQTHHVINSKTIELMRAGALLVNAARGPMVDTAALVDALRRGHLAGAALDVTDPEPLPATHELLTFPNVIVTPHIASATFTARAGMADLAVDNLLHALRGDPMPHCANPEVYSTPRAARPDQTDRPVRPSPGGR